MCGIHNFMRRKTFVVHLMYLVYSRWWKFIKTWSLLEIPNIHSCIQLVLICLIYKSSENPLMYTLSIIPDSKSLVTYHPLPTEHEQITDSTDTKNALVRFSTLCVSMLSALLTTHLTHWSRNEIFDIGQTTFSNTFSPMDTFEFQTELYLNVTHMVPLKMGQH